jgi:hypothetical protein
MVSAREFWPPENRFLVSYAAQFVALCCSSAAPKNEPSHKPFSVHRPVARPVTSPTVRKFSVQWCESAHNVLTVCPQIQTPTQDLTWHFIFNCGTGSHITGALCHQAVPQRSAWYSLVLFLQQCCSQQLCKLSNSYC